MRSSVTCAVILAQLGKLVIIGTQWMCMCFVGGFFRARSLFYTEYIDFVVMRVSVLSVYR